MPVQNNNAEFAAASWTCKGVSSTPRTRDVLSVEQSMPLYSGVLLSWLEKHDPEYFYNQPPQEVHKLVKDTLDLLVGVLNYFSCPTNMLAVVIKYADAFVVRNGIRQVVLLHLLFISTITTIKMWGTENMAVNQIIADLFHLSLADINNMEREFLKSLNYELYLTDADVSGYLATITAAHVASVLRHRVRTAAVHVPAHAPPTTERCVSNKRKACTYVEECAPAPKRRSTSSTFVRAAVVGSATRPIVV